MDSNMPLRPDSPSSFSWLRFVVLGLIPVAVSHEFASLSDIFVLFLLVLSRNWNLIPRFLQFYGVHPILIGASSVALTYCLFQTIKCIGWKRSRPRGATLGDKSPRPLLFPSKTTHTRLFPKSHSFSYSYLLVGIPVGWRGSAGGMLAADQGASRPALEAEDSSVESGWYTVSAADYLVRGHGNLGLDGKLKQFLINEGENHEEYPYAYLVTAPRFMGYSFNPVSFWYLYSKGRELTAMVLEVNNTFDERHLYFLKPSQNPADSVHAREEQELGSQGSFRENGRSTSDHTSSMPTRFSNSWHKEFHVSPFNSRKGSYSLVAYDPLYPAMTGRGPINNTITLLSSKHHPKLVARIVSEGAATDPGDMNFWRKLLFLSSWWWVGFVTFPRIVREAGKLFFKRKLHVWFRPEPLKSSISRNADITEQLLERCFRNYLHYLIKIANPPVEVKYTPAGIRDAVELTISSPLIEGDSRTAQTLEIKVLTPIFYSRFVQYAHDLEAIFSELNENGTVWVSSPSLLPNLLLKKPQPPQNISGWADYLSFRLIQNIRRRPSQIGGAERSTGQAKATRDASKRDLDIRTFRLSAMDGYFLAHGTSADRRIYRTQVLKVLISDRIAFGSIEILTAGVFLLKCGISWIIARNFLTLHV